MALKTLTMLVLLFLAVQTLRAQEPPQPDVIDDRMFPPELLVQRGDEIGLTDAQMKTAREEVDKAQTRFAELQQRLGRETRSMGELLKQDRPREEAVLAQLDKVLDVEREMKKAQVSLVLRLGNGLTAEQRAKLREVKAKATADAQRLHKSIEPKLRKVEAGARKREGAGGRSPAGGPVAPGVHRPVV